MSRPAARTRALLLFLSAAPVAPAVRDSDSSTSTSTSSSTSTLAPAAEPRRFSALSTQPAIGSVTWKETSGIRYCGGGGGWYRFNSSSDGPFGEGCGVVKCTATGGCPNIPAAWSDQQGVAACKTLCAPDDSCLGFTYYPGNASAAKLTSCCFRSGSVASKPTCAGCTERCYEKPPPPPPAPPDPRLRPIFHVPTGNPPGFVGDANGLLYCELQYNANFLRNFRLKMQR